VLIIIDPPASAEYNMNKDNLLFEQAQQKGVAFARFYSWENYAISLGYRQKADDFAMFSGSKVYRISGGGAVLHCPGELTYSLGVPGNYRNQLNIQQTCADISQIIINVLVGKGINAKGFLNAKNARISGEICFSQTASYEVKLKEKKLIGSAQKITKKALFQHGSMGIMLPKDKVISGTPFENIKQDQYFLNEQGNYDYQSLSGEIAQAFKVSLLKQIA